MEFNKAYNRQEFVKFLHGFLPDDLTYDETPVAFRTKMTYSTQAVKLGSSVSLDLVVYEIRHSSKNDARVSLSKEAFRMLADEMEDRALVIFVPEDNNANYRFSLIEITLNADDNSARVTRSYSNPRRYSYFLGEGIAYYTPNKYLNEKDRVVNPEDLRSRFSVEVLTKEFYQELSDWYAWAIKIIRFPNNLNDNADDDKFNNESAIRLITRLIFVWFLKQRHLVPDEFFDEQYIADNLIQNFNPHAKIDLFYKSDESKYYKAILQNLFFAMLNSPITPEGSKELSERHFRNGRGDYDNNKLMRYESYFKNPQLFVDLANRTVPFLNGGLFDCLDEKDKDLYYDGFSDRETVKKALIVPDYLFFGEEVGKNIDLSEWYGDKKKKKVSARGIIDILKRYNFTVEENTPFDQEVSLDPELLGKVFENLLASYNPETQTTARKQTGSFYTPREIVQYMVDESLVAHLKRTVGDELEEQYRQLMQYTDAKVSLTEDQRKQIMQSLYNCKVLDPACGSGAFPMGMLQQMVHILSRIDPDNTQWKEMMLKVAIDETSEAYRTASSDERKEIIADIERSFDESVNRPDYARKLYLIENCIYGVDIQPIAIQISKLRFFISLVVDQKTNDNPAENFGIRPLPNLEAKFVAANTLIGLQKKDASLFDTDVIKAKEKELKIAKHKIFGAKTVRTKRKYRQLVNDLRLEITKMLEDCGAVGNAEAQQLASWDMFDQNASSPFFDSDWMFGVKNGFDIVIGNPPYISASAQIADKQLAKQRKDIIASQRFKSLYQKWDLYIPFIEFGMDHICKPEGLCTMIVPYPLTNQLYAKVLRKMIVTSFDMFEIVDLNGTKIFENATVSNCIPFIKKSQGCKTVISHIDKQMSIYHSFVKEYKDLIQDKNNYVWNLTQEERIGSRHPTFNMLGDYCYISYGLRLNSDEKKAKGEFVKADLLSETEDSIHCRKLIEGKDIEKYHIKRFHFVEWNTSRCPAKLVRPTFQEFYNHPKIFCNYLGELACTIDFENYYIHTHLLTGVVLWKDLKGVNNKSIQSSVKKFSRYNRDEMERLSEEVDLRFLLGIMNSTYATVLLRDLRGGDYHIYPEHIRNIPIAPATKEQQQPIINLVETILTAKHDNPNADTSLEEHQIDLLVYHLYGLTYDEVLIVDPQTPITREEYETVVD
ncbi:Eco57I restriction-modification methylase domain-containing protein [Bacteroides uniformis]|jgi:hypothetical protein B2_16718|uniref:Eco57I restriction-modification methylase domain-containing protein n=1 Tax=Bacteroides uniformis TaxID=820 RepID=UPI0039B4F20E